MNQDTPKQGQDNPSTYEITVQGWIDGGWSSWFDGLTIMPETDADGNPITRLTGTVVDQAALLGLLRRLHNLRLRLLSVNQVR